MIDEQNMAHILVHGVEALAEQPRAKGLGGVLYEEARNGEDGTTVSWGMYEGGDLLMAYRVSMGKHLRPDMVGMILGVKNTLPGPQTSTDTVMQLLAEQKEMSIHNVADAMDAALIRNGDYLAGDRVILVTGLTIDRRVLNAKQVNGGEIQVYEDPRDWETGPAVQAMRYWMDMP